MEGFNPRVRAGRDSVVFVAFMFALFQSTRPRGTRPRADCDALIDSLVSIHASARDATPSVRLTEFVRLFQSTRPRGTRPRQSG